MTTMYNFFPNKEAVEAPMDDRRFSCPTCHHPLNHLDGGQGRKQNNHPNPTPNNNNPQCYYVMQPAVGPVYGFPPAAPPPGYMPFEDDDDLNLNNEEWSEVFQLYMQKLNAKRRQGKKKRGRRAPAQNRMGEVENN